MKLLNCVLLFFLISITTTSYGKDIYIDYNSSKDCMDSYEYAKDGNEETPYLYFHLKISDNEKIILESGEDFTPRQYKPSNTLTCKDIERDEKFVEDVNSGLLEVFVVQEHTYGFRVYKVKKAEYYYNTSIAFGSRAENYSYSYYYNQNLTGNLATKGSKADVFFEERDDNDCLSRYKFRINSDPKRKSFENITILPEIGILYKKSDPVPPLANGAKLELKKINDYNIVDYLGLICKFYGGKNKNNPTGSTASTGTTTPSTGTTGSTTYPSTGTTKPSTGTSPVGPTYPSNGGVVITGLSTPGIIDAGRIYLDVDKGYYVDSSNGQRAEGTFGGNTYRNGYMINNQNSYPTNTTPTTTLPTTTTGPSSTPTTTTPPVADNSGCLEVSTADTHIVRKKETLFGIARTYGLSVQQIKKWNKIGSNNRIYPCMRLSITAPASKPAKGISADCDEQPTYNSHIVQKTETLFSIAKSYGITVNQIKAWNGLRRNTIYPCTRLTIQAPIDYNAKGNAPTAANYPSFNGIQPTIAYIIPAGVPATTTPSTIPTGYDQMGGKGARTHTVAKNETLFRISAIYGIKLNELRRLNNLSSDMIKPGQVLVVSNAPTAATQPAANNVPKEYIYINPSFSNSNQPQGVAPKPILSGKGNDLLEVNVNGNKRLVHVVQDDETLESIAKYFNTSVAKLRALNDMDRNEVIVPSQRLYVE